MCNQCVMQPRLEPRDNCNSAEEGNSLLHKRKRKKKRDCIISCRIMLYADGAGCFSLSWERRTHRSSRLSWRTHGQTAPRWRSADFKGTVPKKFILFTLILALFSAVTPLSQPLRCWFFFVQRSLSSFKLLCGEKNYFIALKCCLSRRHATLLLTTTCILGCIISPISANLHSLSFIIYKWGGLRPWQRGHTRSSYRSDLWLRALSKVHFGSGLGCEID